MIYQYQREPYLKRVPTVIDRSVGIQAYDVDNLYPQRADEVRKRSYTTRSCVEAIKDFIDGEGFEDQVLSALVFNSEGMTGNDLLDHIAIDKAPFDGWAFHVKYNLNYKMAEITPIDFMFCRLGLPDKDGNVNDIKYSINWEMDYTKTIDNIFRVECFPVFNPDPLVVQAQIEEYGWENYPGQIMYWTPKPGLYPTASFDAVFDDAQTQSEIGVYNLATIQNDYGIEKIFRYPGKFENEQQALDLKRKLNPHKGAKGAKSTLIVEDPGEGAKPLIESVQMQNTDKMHEFTSKDTKNAIRESMCVPAPIIGQLPENGMFNTQQMQDCYTYLNSKTSGHRNQISRWFKKYMVYWKDMVTINSFEIIPQAYGVKATSAAIAPAPTAQTGQFNESLASMSGKQNMQFMRILREIDKGTLTREQGIAKMKLTFGFSDEQANSLLKSSEEEIAA